MKLVSIKRDELIRKLTKLGFETVSSNKHLKMVKGQYIVMITRHKNTDITPSMLSSILKQGNIDRKQWVSN